MVDNNDSLYREVQEELRREQFAKLWKRYGNYILAGAASVVLLVGGYQYWQHQKIATAQTAGSRYEAAIALATSGKTEEANKALEDIAATGPRGYATLADMGLAAASLKAGKTAEAVVIFDRVAADAGADPLLASFAKLQAAALRLGEADFTEMENRLKPLTSDTSPWRYLAKEYLGTAALKAGKQDEARAILSPLLSDALLPSSAAERIRRLMDTIATAELASKPAAETKPADPSPAPAP